MSQLPKPIFGDQCVQLVATVLRETLQHRGTYKELLEFACDNCGALSDEWGFCECITGQDN